ncbi:MAG: hypothetical protein ACR2JC_00885 [Chloroflexota bacterium]|nr:MAG: hypothetical protein DLM70_08690 [Chloroflexota bacterium]
MGTWDCIDSGTHSVAWEWVPLGIVSDIKGALEAMDAQWPKACGDDTTWTSAISSAPRRPSIHLVSVGVEAGEIPALATQALPAI